MKAFSFLTVFLLAGLFLVSFVYYAEAGIPGEHGACVNNCNDDCDVHNVDCSGRTGQEKRDCEAVNNIFETCCYITCLEETCGEEVPNGSVVCEALEEFCGGDPD